MTPDHPRAPSQRARPVVDEDRGDPQRVVGLAQG